MVELWNWLLNFIQTISNLWNWLITPVDIIGIELAPLYWVCGAGIIILVIYGLIRG